MVIVDTVTSIVGTIAIFLTLGHAAYVAGPDYSIDDLFNSGKLTRFQARSRDLEEGGGAGPSS